MYGFAIVVQPSTTRQSDSSGCNVSVISSKPLFAFSLIFLLYSQQSLNSLHPARVSIALSDQVSLQRMASITFSKSFLVLAFLGTAVLQAQGYVLNNLSPTITEAPKLNAQLLERQDGYTICSEWSYINGESLKLYGPFTVPGSNRYRWTARLQFGSHLWIRGPGEFRSLYYPISNTGCVHDRMLRLPYNVEWARHRSCPNVVLVS